MQLRTLRLRRKWTQVQLAKKVGVTQKHISHLEIGRRYPSIKIARRLAQVLGVRLSTLLED